jgi:hypothetical protein
MKRIWEISAGMGQQIVISLRVLCTKSRRLFRSYWNHFMEPFAQILIRVPCLPYQLNVDGLPTYFGYYDKTTFSYDSSKILVTDLSNFIGDNTNESCSCNSPSNEIR